jgi:hypothetical protein
VNRNAGFVLAAATTAVVLGVIVIRLTSSQPTSAPLDQPSCGRAVNSGSSHDARPTDCIWQAYLAGTTAQAIVVQYTTEGDPMTYAINLVSANRIDVTIQSKDRFGPKGSFAYSCQGLTRQPAQNPSLYFLVATDCSGPRDFLDGSRLVIP